MNDGAVWIVQMLFFGGYFIWAFFEWQSKKRDKQDAIEKLREANFKGDEKAAEYYTRQVQHHSKYKY